MNANPAVEEALRDLNAFHGQNPWEYTVCGLAFAVLHREGITGLSKVVEGQDLVQGAGAVLTPREMSDLLAVLQNSEADRLVRSREIFKEILAFALKAAEALLKAALGGPL